MVPRYRGGSPAAKPPTALRSRLIPAVQAGEGTSGCRRGNRAHGCHASVTIVAPPDSGPSWRRSILLLRLIVVTVTALRSQPCHDRRARRHPGPSLEHGVRFTISRAACHTSRSSIMRRRFALDVGFQLALIQCGQPSDDNHSNHGEDNKDVYHEFLLHSGHRGAGGRTAASCSASASDPRS
jgi:hypothetical protein